jgi:hypothetical protein
MEGHQYVDDLPQHTMWELLQFASADLANELRATIDKEDQFCPATIRRVLADTSPAAFSYLASVQELLHDANEMVTGGVKRFGVFARTAIQLEQENKKRREAAASVQETRQSSKKKGKVDLVQQPPDLDVVIEKTDPNLLFAGKDMWTDLYPCRNYAIPGSRLPAESVINRYDLYKTIYHCTSKWAMENLCEKLHAEGFEALGLRDKTVSYDLDMCRWKVISSKPYELN